MIILHFKNGDKVYRDVSIDSDYARIEAPIPDAATEITILFSIPIIDIQYHWTPKSRVPETRLPWSVCADAAAQSNFPFLSFMNTALRNRCAISLTNLIDDSAITAKMNQEMATLDISARISLSPRTTPFYLIIDRRDVPWTDSLSTWRKELALPPAVFPEAAWNPVFCTWYAVHAAITQDWTERNAKAAAELGFGTLIIDDGWCFSVRKRVSPQTIGTWYERIGDWAFSVEKFPDVRRHIRRVQEMGLKYLVWVAPFLVGEKSAFFRDHPDCLKRPCQGGCCGLDLSNPDEAAEMQEKMTALMRNYPLDGLKVDFLDFMPPDLERPRGRDVYEFIRTLSASIRLEKPEALIEFRQNYATPLMLNLGTQFRAGDVPFDYIDNFQRLCQIRISVGDGVPVHADPAYWGKSEKAENISRHLIASLAGVPMLSMELLALNETERAILVHWLEFYRRHLSTFREGKWDIRYRFGHLAWASVATGSESIIILQDDACLAKALAAAKAGATHLLNLSPAVLDLPGAASFDYAGKTGRPGAIPLGGRGLLP